MYLVDMPYERPSRMSNLNVKQTAKPEKVSTAEVKHAEKPSIAVSAREIAKSWTSFEAKVPLTYLVAARKAAREKNS